ncbi:TPA: transposase [Mannheimia haemolytica]|nr:transposase [Mannheimia haemolytica]
MQYRRLYKPNSTYFFTLNLADRKSDLLIKYINELRMAIKIVKNRYPFEIDAIVVLPDHLHMLCTFGEDCDYSKRIRLIKTQFSMSIPKSEEVSISRQNKGEWGIWQRRFWEHCIRDEKDLEHHINYIHINPLKHGLVEKVSDWKYSSFHRYVNMGILPNDWGN